MAFANGNRHTHSFNTSCMKSFNLKLKIRHKLFLAILAANCLLMDTIYIFGSWMFDTSFRDYLDQSEATRLTPLTIDLANEYSTQGNGLEIVEIQLGADV